MVELDKDNIHYEEAKRLQAEMMAAKVDVIEAETAMLKAKLRWLKARHQMALSLPDDICDQIWSDPDGLLDHSQALFL